jgi:quinol monooxygenase YgiN
MPNEKVESAMSTDNSSGEIVVVHTLNFSTSPVSRSQFHEYANTQDGLPVARGAAGNMFVTPYDGLRNEHTTYMFSRWESGDAWDAYTQHRKGISPDWFLPMVEPQHILRLRELDSSPTINSTQAPFYGAPEGSVCNFHIWQFDDVELKEEVSKFWGMEPGLRSSVAHPGNIIVSAFEAIDKENQLVVISAWENEEIFLAYRQMRRETAPDIVQPFLVDQVMVQSRIMNPDSRASI